MSNKDYIDKGAIMSDDGVYRYNLWRQWTEWPLKDTLKSCLFIMLNPSTADEQEDDATIRKCVKFAKRWGYDRLEVANLFAFRTKDPKELKSVNAMIDPIGKDNERLIKHLSSYADKIVLAWGANGNHLDQNKKVLRWLSETNLKSRLEALRVSEKTGQPWHPLYIPDDTDTIPFGQEFLTMDGYRARL